MVNRRTVLRSALALATGSALVGTAGSESASSADGALAPYDAGSVTDAETTVSARVNPRAFDRSQLPQGVATRLSSLRDRFDSLSVSALGSVRGSVALSGDRIVGAGVVVDGDFERSAVTSDLTADSFSPFEGHGLGGVEVYRSESTPYAVGLDTDTIAVGYGREAVSPLTHVRAAFDSANVASTRLTSIADAVGGRSRAAAKLGRKTRSQAIERIPSETAGLAEIVAEATAFGVGIDVTEGRSTVAYGVDIDPAAVSTDTYWDLITRSATRADGFELGGVEQDRRTIVVRGTVPTNALWSVHAELIGIKTE
ncbi:MAG: hypothetical protein U5K70_02890 [Halodesulfurarchaeum sp.]|nr:hypothetical protein [Halodesulfurarchaeum sp.]